MDVKSTFLNGELEEEVYAAQPLGFTIEGEERKAILHKALYGLRQDLRAGNVNLDKTLTNLGFEKCPTHHALYKRLRQ